MSKPKMMILLLGGQPKGYDEPFSKATLSGKRLHALADALPFDFVHYADLWLDHLEENKGAIWPQTEEFLKGMQSKGFVIVALGGRVQKALRKNTTIHFVALPHPAARRKTDLQRLREGLTILAGSPNDFRQRISHAPPNAD